MTKVLVRRAVARTARAALCSAAVALVTAACSPTPGSDNSTATAGPISTTVPTGEKITLTLTDYEAGGTGDAIVTLIKNFQALHPNVTIERQYTAFADYGKNIKLVMSSDKAPDIAQVGQAHVMMGPLVKGKLIRPLDDYAAAYGWSDRFGPGLLDQLRFEDDARSFGSGKLYGASVAGNLVGVYYNRAKLQALGVEPDAIADLTAFTDTLAKAKAAGELPIQLGNLEAWPANHLLSDLIAQYDDLEAVRNWVYGKPGASLDRPGVKQAAATLQSWVSNGYVAPSANGTAYDDGVSKFIKGEGVFMVTGNWVQARIDQEMKGAAGFMLLPPAKAGAPARATGALTSPFAVSSKSKHPDVAAAFINYMISQEASPTLFKGGYLPALNGESSTAGPGTAQEGTLEGWRKVTQADGMALYMDWATPSMGDTLFSEVQKLLGGKQSADGLITAVQGDWNTFTAK
ncbi:extracellular solute-binding protein [Actinomycetes bacterium KLBMP 9797]